MTNCHYADDTILLLQTTLQNVEKVWWTHRAFEALSKIRINEQKTELYALNIDTPLAQELILLNSLLNIWGFLCIILNCYLKIGSSC